MSKSIFFGKKNVGRGYPVYIVLEAGPTHDGLQTALALIDVAAESGADAVKFQILDADALVPDPNVMFSYDVLCDKESGKSETITESLHSILKRRELSREEWRIVVHRCLEKNIDFFSTATSVDEMQFLFELGAGSVKIASGDINFHYLLRQAAIFPWAVQIDTGNATIGEVEAAVDILENAGCKKIIINHCPSGYPARLDGINLRVLTTLQQMFPYPIAFSDHTPGATMDIAAVALGVSMIEKTITLDRTIRSPEHIMSLEPHEAAAFVCTIREVEKAMGQTRRVMPPQEKAVPPVARRSIVAARAIDAGETLTQEMIEYARPGTGLAANYDWMILGKKVRHSLTQGEQLSIGHVE